MTITIDDDLVEKLCDFDGPVSLVAKDGRLVGLFRRNPVLPPPYDPSLLPPPISEEELARRRSEGPLLTTEEVFQKLKALG